MEMSVSFTDGTEDVCKTRGGGFRTDVTVLGKVYIPVEGVAVTGPLRIRYEKHPWLECFELDGIRALPDRRTGTGTKDARGFVKSLSTIYSGAYDDYRKFGGDETFDAVGYFGNAARHFVETAHDPDKRKLFRMFCGFTENMWREGDQAMLEAAMETVVPLVMDDPEAREAFMRNITEEFRDYIRREGYGI